MAPDHAIATDVAKPSLTFLDRATEFKFGLLLLSFAAALDVFLVIQDSQSLLTYHWAFPGDLGLGLLFLGSYAFYMSMAAPLAQATLQTIPIPIFSRKLVKNPDPRSYVRSRQLKQEAVSKNSALLLGYAESKENEVASFRREMDYLARIYFSCAVLLVIEASVSSSTLRVLWQHIAHDVSWECLFLLPMFALSLWLREIRRDYSARDWIYYPSLARRLHAQNLPPDRLDREGNEIPRCRLTYQNR